MYEKGIEYCKKTQNNRLVPKYVQKQCADILNIVNDKDDTYMFDMSKAEKIEKLLTLVNVPKGEGVGESVIYTLTGFQWLLLIVPFSIVRRDDHNSRKYSNILLEICRKNAKSYISGLIALILMLLEPKFSRFFTVSPTGALSQECFRAIKEFIAVSPAIDKHFKITKFMARCKLTESEYMPLNYSTSTLDGRLANCFLADEIGALPCIYPIEAMRSSQVLLDNKLGILMSTKYPSIDNPLESEVDYCKKVLDGIIDDPHTFSLLYEPDNPDGDWTTDETILAHGNPLALDVPVLWDNLIAKRDKAVEMKAAQSNFLTKHCNIITLDSDSEAFVDIKDVQACSTDEAIDWTGKEVYIGIDLSMTDDNTAVTMIGRDEYGHLIVRPMCFIPKGRQEYKTKNEKVDYQKYIDEGDCIACGDDIIGYDCIEDYIISLPDKLGVNILAVGYDRYNAMSTVNKLQNAGIDCVEVKQHSSVLAAPTKQLFEEITTHNMRFERNTLYEINFANAVCTFDTNLNRYVHKKKSRGKVDMVVATLDAMALLQTQELADENWVCS